MGYNEEDYLQLSGLQHFRFCRRQWALIHIEQQWAENFRTIDGELMHERVHDKDFNESRGDCIVTRGMHVFSAELGVSGECDLLEFRRDPKGIALPGRAGLWLAYPVEYKRGRPNEQSGDALQLCGQAMCLEEMLCCKIPEGALYYGELRRRVPIALDDDLRGQVRASLTEMHDLSRRGSTPRVKPTKSCGACSLKEICLPVLMRTQSASAYILEHLKEVADEAAP